MKTHQRILGVALRQRTKCIPSLRDLVTHQAVGFQVVLDTAVVPDLIRERLPTTASMLQRREMNGQVDNLFEVKNEPKNENFNQ